MGATGCMQFLPSTFYGNIRWAGQMYSLKSEATPELIAHHMKRIGRSDAVFYKGYGVDGDGDGKIEITNCADSMFSAANYLKANYDVKGNYYGAVWQYNHADWYVKKVQKESANLGFKF
jgi:membrane-bound lytic murein transglycosylase B